MIIFLDPPKNLLAFMKYFVEKLDQYGATVADAGVITADEPRKRSEDDNVELGTKRHSHRDVPDGDEKEEKLQDRSQLFTRVCE